MGESAVRCGISTSHIRLLDPSRDLAAVADLLEEAFRSELDPAGWRAVRETRWLGRMGWWLAWLDPAAFTGTGTGPGLVWIEQGKVVGHLSLRRAEWGRSVWLIGNVAVRVAYRGQGIAHALMSEAIEHVRQQAGSRVNLLVRADNFPAVRVYTDLGFRQTAALAYWQRPPQRRRTRRFRFVLLEDVMMQRAQPGDSKVLYDLVRAGLPDDLDWAEPVRRSDFYVGWDRRLADWLSGRRHVCVVARLKDELVGAAWADAPRFPDEGRLRVWTSADHRGVLEEALVHAALDGLREPVASLVCAFPASQMQMYTALARAGFLPVRILAHMQLGLY